MNFNLSFGFGNKPKSVHIDERGNIQYTMEDMNPHFAFKSFKGKYNYLLSSPAFMSPAKKIFDLASQVRINSYSKDDKILKVNALYDVAERPNMFQSWTEFHATVALRATIGCAWIYAPNDKVGNGNSIFVLDPERVKIEKSLLDRFAKLMLTKQSYNELYKDRITYTYPNGEEERIELRKIKVVSAMPNGFNGNFWECLSLIDCLVKPIVNSESALDSENVQLFLARKVLLTKDKKTDLGSFDTMGDQEKGSIERSVMSNKVINAVNTELKATRLIENKEGLKLPESYQFSSLIIADVLGVDKSLLPFSTATYENQEKGAGRTIEYAVLPIMEKYIEVLEKLTGLTNLKASYEHCSFNQVFEKERAEKNKVVLENIEKAIAMNLLSEEDGKKIADSIFGL